MRARSLRRQRTLPIAIFLILHPLHVAAQTGAEGRVIAGDACQAEPRETAVAPAPAQPGLAHRLDIRTAPDGTGMFDEHTLAAVAREIVLLTLSDSLVERTSVKVQQQPAQEEPSWIGRHPTLFGTIVGFGGGFLVGYLSGDDGVFYDFTAFESGLILGGIGAGTGALVGTILQGARN